MRCVLKRRISPCSVEGRLQKSVAVKKELLAAPREQLAFRCSVRQKPGNQLLSDVKPPRDEAFNCKITSDSYPYTLRNAASDIFAVCISVWPL